MTCKHRNIRTEETEGQKPQTFLRSAVKRLVSLPGRINHQLAHLTGWNMGKIESWFKDGALMVGFRCATCGKLEGVYMARQFRKGKVN